jgi:hypothetical protein
VISRISPWHCEQGGGWGKVAPDRVLRNSFEILSVKRDPRSPFRKIAMEHLSSRNGCFRAASWTPTEARWNPLAARSSGAAFSRLSISSAAAFPLEPHSSRHHA